jgi:hypothetical protein
MAELRPHVLVDVEVLEDLRIDALFLECLGTAGVDNWSGYEYACDLFERVLKSRGIE